MRGGTYHIERNPLICRADFYMIGTSVMKELNINTSQTSMEQNLNLIRSASYFGNNGKEYSGSNLTVCESQFTVSFHSSRQLHVQS